MTLQNVAMRGRGVGWQAERCLTPERCEGHLCVADDQGAFWHPADPLAFAQWRVRADLDRIPAQVRVRVGRGRVARRRDVVWTAVGLGSLAAVLGMLWSRRRLVSMKTLRGASQLRDAVHRARARG
ncbi:MAG TPA: hypothetical protein VJX92_13515 [Methylomirabilota bacterium]|nr:hypothetical protein [Methylomirabilota bacterium]